MDFLQVIHHFSLVTASVLLIASMLALFKCWILPVTHNRKLRRSGLTGPPPVFPLGNISEMMQKRKNTSETSSCGGSSGVSHDIHSTVFPYFSQWRAKYGKVFIYWLGTEPFLYIGDPEFLKQVASGVKSKAWGKPSVFKRDRKPLFGKGLVMAEGDDWSRQRHIITPAFSSTNLKAMMSDMVESTRKMTDKWKNLVGNKEGEINIERDVIQNAAEIIAQTSFGIMDHQHGQKVFEKLIGLQNMLFRPNRLVGVPFCNLFHPLKTLESVRLGQEIDQLLLSIILSRMTGADEQQPDVAAKKNLLSLMIAQNRRDKKLSARDMVDECKTFFFGGLETTGLAISWTLLLLALHPEWQCELREEIREVTGGESLDFPMLGQLEKMGWVLNEVIRLYSPAPNVQRQAREDIRSGDVIIPKGTNVWIDVVGMHHDPELWGAEVNEFRPERFKAEPQGGCTHRMGYLPFGFGGRLCVGKNLSVMEYKVVLTQILSMFSFSVSPNYFHSPTIMLSMRPSSGIHLIIKSL